MLFKVLHLTIQALSLATLQACNWDKGNWHSHKHNRDKNPNWQDADSLAICKEWLRIWTQDYWEPTSRLQHQRSNPLSHIASDKQTESIVYSWQERVFWKSKTVKSWIKIPSVFKRFIAAIPVKEITVGFTSSTLKSSKLTDNQHYIKVIHCNWAAKPKDNLGASSPNHLCWIALLFAVWACLKAEPTRRLGTLFHCRQV